jgi:hypothetical protein
MKKLLIIISLSVFFWACSKDKIDLASPEALSGTDWRTFDVGIAGTPVYLNFKFTSTSQVELWSKHLNETDYSQILSGDYSIKGNEIKINFGKDTVSGYIEGESINFLDINTWQSVGPDFMIERIACSGNFIYAITNNNGVYLSSNGGNDWKAVNFGPNSEMAHGVDIEFKDGNVFAGSNWGGIYLSTNNGLDWNKVSDTPSDQIEIIGNTVISARNNFSIQISTDNGSTWEIVNSNIMNDFFWALTSFGNNLYAGTFEGQIYFSADYGKTLTSIALFNNAGIMSLIIDGDNIFAGTQGKGIAFSSNNGLNWKTLAGISGLTVNALAKKGDLIVAHGENIIFSNDNGNNWKTIYNGGHAIYDIQITENYIYAGAPHGILRLPIPLLYLPNSTFTLYH